MSGLDFEAAYATATERLFDTEQAKGLARKWLRQDITLEQVVNALNAQHRLLVEAAVAETTQKYERIVNNHREVLADMVNQFAYRVSDHDTYFTDGGLSTLERAIPALVSCGWVRKVAAYPHKDWYEFVPEAERSHPHPTDR